MGTGLFLGSGHVIQGAGPLGALIAYGLVGTIAYGTICSLAEMASFAPISGSFPHYAARWVDPAFGFALGCVAFIFQIIFQRRELFSEVLSLNLQVELLLHQCNLDSRRDHRRMYTTHLLGCKCVSNEATRLYAYLFLLN